MELENDRLSQEDKPVPHATWSIDLNISSIIKQLFESEKEPEVVPNDLNGVDTFFPLLNETDLPVEFLSVFEIYHPEVDQAIGKEANTGPPLN
ncbi:MAG TPA: hypothetical protein VN364_11530 [Bellilinea sp.]|nr:hypothetical protein [Bellilinea sp.]